MGFKLIFSSLQLTFFCWVVSMGFHYVRRPLSTHISHAYPNYAIRLMHTARTGGQQESVNTIDCDYDCGCCHNKSGIRVFSWIHMIIWSFLLVNFYISRHIFREDWINYQTIRLIIILTGGFLILNIFSIYNVTTSQDDPPHLRTTIVSMAIGVIYFFLLSIFSTVILMVPVVPPLTAWAQLLGFSCWVSCDVNRTLDSRYEFVGILPLMPFLFFGAGILEYWFLKVIRDYLESFNEVIRNRERLQRNRLARIKCSALHQRLMASIVSRINLNVVDDQELLPPPLV